MADPTVQDVLIDQLRKPPPPLPRLPLWRLEMRREEAERREARLRSELIAAQDEVQQIRDAIAERREEQE